MGVRAAKGHGKWEEYAGQRFIVNLQEAASLENCKDLEQRLAAATAERDRLAHALRESETQVLTLKKLQYWRLFESHKVIPYMHTKLPPPPKEMKNVDHVLHNFE
jgi:hypothetical protein